MIYDKRNRENLAKLGDNTKSAAIKWYESLVANKIEVLIYETIRSLETQKANVAKGASQTLRSYHLVGQALDFVMVDSKGNALWNGYGSADAKKAVALAKKLGFEWGGDWTNFYDAPHLQFNHKGYGTDTFGKKVEVKKPVTKPVVAKPTVTKKPIVVKDPVKKAPAKPKVVGHIQIVGVKYSAYIVATPSTKGKVLATISKGGRIAITGSVPGWFEVLHDGERAYINEEYGKRV